MTCLLLLISCTLFPAGIEAGTRPTVIVVKGADGTPEYGEIFTAAAESWKRACAEAGNQCLIVGLDQAGDGATDLARLETIIGEQDRTADVELWIVLIGHGTFDGRTAKFNLTGPDLDVDTLGSWLAEFTRTIVLINTSSSSGPFLSKLSAPGRVIVTATKSGHEQNYTRLNETFAAVLSDQQADLDKDGQISVLECFLAASRKASEFYEQEGRLATEHALLDDNGDGLGTPANWFHGVMAVKRAKEGAALDGRRAHQIFLVPSPQERQIPPAIRQKRNEMELQIFALRDRKAELPEDEYYKQFEALVVEFARLSQEMTTEEKVRGE